MIVAVEPTATVPVRCIEVDSPDHMFLCSRSFIPTHNSCSAVLLALWFYHCHEMARVIVTATTNPQIRNIFWRELRIRASRALIPFPHVPEMPGIGMRSDDGTKEIIGLSTKEAERMAGFSGQNLLFIVDEASGVPEHIFEAIEGNRAGGARIVMLGNPTQPSGTFFDAFHSKRELWRTLHISSWEAARMKHHIPGLATETWCEEKLLEWGQSDPRYQVRVEGNFADSSEMSVVPLHHVMAAQGRFDEQRETGMLMLGCDVARFGDDETVLAVVRGKRLCELVTASKLDEVAVAKLVVETAARHRVAGEPAPEVKVDACGVGLGVLSILRNAEGLRAIGVNAGDPADNPEDFKNKRSQLWFGLAEWLSSGGAIPHDAKLEADLLAPQFSFDPRGRRRVEAKDDIKRRLKRSPDRADALALAVHHQRLPLVHPASIRDQRRRRRPNLYRFGAAGRGY